MSAYSLDSLENATSSKSCIVTDTVANESAREGNNDGRRRSPGIRNVMIANAASAKRGAERHVFGSRLPTRKGHNGVRSVSAPKEFSAETPDMKCIRFIRRSDNQSESQPSWADDDGPMVKADKKLHNVLPPKIPSPRKPVSYLELHRRRFSVPPLRRRIRSPVGSTLSICGDSQQERLTDDSGDVSLLQTSSRDDQSELSFYRRLIERGDCPGLWDSFGKERLCGSSFDVCRQGYGGSFLEAESRSRRKVTYRPYTIEDYRSLSVPQRDRSLGPDKAEIQVKREWLMRRRSYGDSVSARNRQQILQRARELKSRRVGAQKYPQPPLKDRDADSKGHGNSFAFYAGDAAGDCQRKDRGKRTVGVRETERAAASGSTSSGEKSRTLEKSAGCLCASLNSRGDLEDSRLRQLRLRHFRQRVAEDWMAGKLADQLRGRSKREEICLT